MTTPPLPEEIDAAATATDERNEGTAMDRGESNSSSSPEEPQSITATPAKNKYGDHMESIVRISLAGLGGRIVGMGLEARRNQQQQQQDTIRRQAFADSHNPSRNHFRSFPPITMRNPGITMMGPQANLPATWALSCSIFVLILETSRRTSPTSRILASYLGDEDFGRKRIGSYQHRALVTTGDYAVGGMAAGLAGAVARKTPARWGLGVGATLGLLAGLVQSAADVAEMYLKEQQDKP